MVSTSLRGRKVNRAHRSNGKPNPARPPVSGLDQVTAAQPSRRHNAVRAEIVDGVAELSAMFNKQAITSVSVSPNMVLALAMVRQAEQTESLLDAMDQDDTDEVLAREIRSLLKQVQDKALQLTRAASWVIEG